MADFSQLSRLTRKADSVANSASVLVRQALREIRGELANLSSELNLAGNAQDREKVYAGIRRRMALLSRRMNTLMASQNERAAKSAVESAASMTGLEVKYSPSRAKAICELVTPAQGENIAAVFTDRMGRALINSLREATVGMLREQAVAGGSMKDMARDLAARWAQAAKDEDPKFTDSAGRVWDTKTYIQMNVRTNTMRVYNDVLADTVARETGGDLMRISTGGDPDCDCCAAWEGCIVSLAGKTKGLPTYEDARSGGCFHPNCTHTLEYVDETVDADEIALQKAHPVDTENASDSDAQDERKYQIDQARYMRDNPEMTKEQARVAVDRDNLAASIQSGLVRADAREIVAKMTDAQVTALCPAGNPPAFEPVKGTKKHQEPEKWNHGARGGTVHIARDASAEHILEICKVTDAADKPPAPTVAEVRSGYIREILNGIPDEQMEHLGETFDTSPTEVLRAIAAARSTTSFDSRKGAYCEYGSSAVHLTAREGWSNNPSTLAHEKGHAVLNSLGQKSGEAVQARFAPIATAAREETAAWAKATYGNRWKSECRPREKQWYAEIGKRVFAFSDEVLTGHTPQMMAASAVSDILSAATKGRQFYGHDTHYHRLRPSGDVHEITANVTSLLCGDYLEKARAVLPQTIAAVERIVYGIQMSTPSPSSDTSRTNSS